MSSNNEPHSVLETIAASLPEIANHLATVPDEQKPAALDALEGYYHQTAMDLGYSEGPSRAWASALVAHLREQLELPAEGVEADTSVRPNEEYRLVERLLTRVVGGVALLMASPLIALIWIGLKLEGPGPAIRRRMMRQAGRTAYSFGRGPGWVSRMVRRRNRKAPSWGQRR